MASYHMYRNTTLGNTLQESLDDFITCGQITNSLATKILIQFDKSINTALSNRIKNRLTFKVSPCFVRLTL
jgi:transcription initiation factor TFIIA small subunit